MPIADRNPTVKEADSPHSPRTVCRSNSVFYPEVGKTEVEGSCFGKLSDYPLYV